MVKHEINHHRETTPSKKIWENTSSKRHYPSYPTIERNEGGSKIALWSIAVISFIFLVFAFSTLFAAATITIHPKENAYSLTSSVFKAQKDSPQSDIAFEVMSLEGSMSKSLPAPKVLSVENKAAGKAVIYNDFSKEAQKLIINTRLETGDGKIYRIDNAVTVPGQHVSAGVTVPGSVLVSIHADQAGEEYNIPSSTFTIPGFKGGPKYEKFSAFSKDKIDGGIKGTVHVIDEQDALAARAEMVTALKDDLIKKAKLQVPKGFILYDDAIFYAPNQDKVNLESKEDSVPVELAGKVYGIILDENKLSANIAKDQKDINSDEVIIAGISDLNFSLKNRDQIDPATVSEIEFSLTGQGKVIAKVDEDKLKADLLGKSKKQLQSILANFPNIEKAEAVIKPFWMSSFPGQKKDIKVINIEETAK